MVPDCTALPSQQMSPRNRVVIGKNRVVHRIDTYGYMIYIGWYGVHMGAGGIYLKIGWLGMSVPYRQICLYMIL